MRSRRALYGILLFILLFMPYSTWALQWLRDAVPLPLAIEKALIGWKEILAVAMAGLVGWIAYRERLIPFKVTLLDRYLAAFALVGTVAGFLMTRHLSWAVFGFRYDFSPFVYYFAARTVLLTRDDMLALVRRLALWSAPVLLFGLAQTFLLPTGFMERFGYSFGGTGITGNPLPPYHLAAASLPIVRAMSTFPGPNSLALYAVVVALMVATAGRSVFGRQALWGLGALAVVSLAATFSRGHLIGLACALLVGYVFWKARKNRRYVVGATVVALLFATFAATMYAGRFQSNNAHSTLLTLVLHDTSSSVHGDVRLQAWDSIKAHPFGTGLGTSGLATTNTGVTVANPESWYIQMAVEFGWLGLAAALALLVLVFRLLSDMGDDLSDQDDRKLLYFFVTCFAAVAVGANFLPSWFEVGSLYWWILFGFFLTDYAGSFQRSKALA